MPAPVLLVLAVGVAATVALCAAPAAELARTLPVEDGFYTLSVARQLGTGGGLTIDGHIATNGFQPLWAFVVAPLAALAGGDRVGTLRAALVLSSLLWVAFVALVAALARVQARRRGLDGRLAATLAAIVAAGSVGVLRAFHNGLETGLLLVLLAAAVLALDATRRWSPWRVAGLALVLGALLYARLDTVAFLAAVAAAALWRARRGQGSVAGPWLACAVAAALLVPWLARNLALDGHLVPTSGRAQSTGIDIGLNADAMLRALGSWALAPVFRPSMHRSTVPLSELVAAAGLALVGTAWWRLRRGATPPGPGTVALAAYVAFLTLYYTVSLNAWWFSDRYLAPFVLLALPWLAAAAERGLAARAARVAPVVVAAVVLAANVPLLAVLLAAPRPMPPAWASAGANLGTHPNLNYEPQVTWTRAHVRPGCRVGAFESGTLGYFRARVTNLDGKVDPDALRMRRQGRTPQYVRAKGIEVLVDIPSGALRARRGRPAGEWRRVARFGRFEAWVRSDRMACLIR